MNNASGENDCTPFALGHYPLDCGGYPLKDDWCYCDNEGEECHDDNDSNKIS